MLIIGLSTATLTLIGKIGNKFEIKNLLIFGSFGLLFLAVPLYFSTTFFSVVLTAIA